VRDRAAPIAIFAAFVLVPFLPWGGAYNLAVALMARAAVFGLAALSLDFILGVGGMVSFGHAAFFVIGAYATTILDANHIDGAAPVFATAAIASAFFALVTGAVALRTRGVNFIMITLAFAQMVYFAAGSLADYGGDDGYTLAARTTLLGRSVYYWVCLAILLTAYLLCRRVVASRFGRVLRAIKQNRRRVQALGFDAWMYQLVAYVIAATLCGLAGVLLANSAEFVSPAYGAWQRSGDLLIMVILGGAGSLHGAVVGSIAVVLLEEVLGRFTEHWRLIYGPLLILSVLYVRGGLAAMSAGRPGYLGRDF
jgi:branched-chain amino acid transport system permease protein